MVQFSLSLENNLFDQIYWQVEQNQANVMKHMREFNGAFYSHFDVLFQSKFVENLSENLPWVWVCALMYQH